MAPIVIRENTLDPANPGDVQLPGDASKTDYVLVQLKEEMTPEMVAALHGKSATILKRMEGNTWLLNYPPSDLGELASIDGVEYALVYVDHFVIHADLKQEQPAESAQETPVVAVVLHEAASSSYQNVITEIRGFSSPEIVFATEGLIHLKVNQQNLEKIAALDSVQAIEKAPEIVPFNDQIKIVTGLDAVNQPFLTAKQTGLTGAGQVVAVADSGIDSQHDAFKGPNKIVAQLSVRKTKTNADDALGHGTHVAGTLAGLAVKNWEGHDITGVAPNAGLAVVAALGDEEVTGPPPTWFDEAYNKVPGICRIINNSWGSKFVGTQKPYGAMNAEIIDKWALDHPDFLLVFAAGNYGMEQFLSKPAQVETFAVAKNVLTVGATYTDRPTKEPGVLEALTSGPNDKVDYSAKNLKVFVSKRGTVADFSSRGPVLNTKRTKPDIVAPGVCILSARASSASASVQSGLDEWVKQFGTFPGGGKQTDKLVFASGTSMATPAVSGCAALLREALAKWKNLSNPSGPLMKALLINGADALAKVGPNVQGFGQINMIRTLRPLGPPPASGAGAGALAAAETSGSGYAQGIVKDLSTIALFKTIVPQASANNKKLNFIATLVYHDAKGEQTQNKMNLIITYQGETKETYTATNNENVLRIPLGNVVPGQNIMIQVQPKLIAVTNTVIPWGLAWDHFETEK